MIFSNFSTRSFSPFLPLLDTTSEKHLHYFADASNFFKASFNLLILFNQLLRLLIRRALGDDDLEHQILIAARDGIIWWVALTLMPVEVACDWLEDEIERRRVSP
jgi:hypothetical protein